MAAASAYSEFVLLDRLERFKANPPTDPGDGDIRPFWSRLMRGNASRPCSHWYCDKANAVVRECATYLIRLFAHTEEKSIVEFKQTLGKVLASCEACVAKYQVARANLRQTYLKNYADSVVREFFVSLDASEAQLILNFITTQSLHDAQVVHILSNPNVLVNSNLASIVVSSLPASKPTPSTFPLGLLLLLFHRDTTVRDWAVEQVKSCSNAHVDVASDIVNGYTDTLLGLILARLTYMHEGGRVSKEADESPFFTGQLGMFWGGMPRLLAALSSELISSSSKGKDLTNLILGHLHDSGAHFKAVLRSFLVLLKTHPSMVWKGAQSSHLLQMASTSTTTSSYPSIVFDAIKDNPAYHRLIEDQTKTATNLSLNNLWSLTWFTTLLKGIPGAVLTTNDGKGVGRATTDESLAFNDVLAKMAAFAFEELQHSRFQSCSAAAAQAMITTLQSTLSQLLLADASFSESSSSVDKAHRIASLKDVIERHDDFVISIAFSSDDTEPSDQWREARQAARSLLSMVLTDDVQNMAQMISVLGAYAIWKKAPNEEDMRKLQRLPKLRSGLWPKLYEAVQYSDQEGMRNVLALVGSVAHFDAATLEGYSKSPDPAYQAVAHAQISAINTFIRATRAGFLHLVSKFSDCSSATSVQKFMREDGVVKDLLSLILSPSEDLQNSALAIVSQAFDVDLRAECIKALLENYPEQALVGLGHSIGEFNKYAEQLPEACGFAQALVQGLTDVCDSLCSQSGGVLFNREVRGKILGKGGDASLAQLWNLMAAAISKLFELLPKWAGLYPLRREHMIALIRDSLIFGRQLVGQRKVIQGAVASLDDGAVELESSKRRNHSRTGRRMLEALQPVLMGSFKLLRLTDMELLHQAFKLVEAILEAFTQTDTAVHRATLEKLKQIIRDAEANSTKPDEQRSRLNVAQISFLTSQLEQFSQDRDGSNNHPHASAEAEEVLEVEEIDRQAFEGGMKRRIHRGQEISDGPLASISSSLAKTSLVSVSKQAATVSKPVDASRIPPAQRQPPPLATKAVLNRSAQVTSSRRAANVGSSAARRGPPPAFQPRPPSPSTTKTTTPASSDSESDSDDDEGNSGGLASLNRLQKSPEKRKERRTIKRLDVPVKGASVIQSRLERRDEAHRTAMRLNPDLSGLHNMILEWDFDHNGSEPPGFSQSRPSLRKVPDKFRSPEEYCSVFEPLLTLECWSQMQRAKEEPMEQVSCRVIAKCFVDKWVELEVSVSQTPDPTWFVAETDILLFRKPSGGPGFLAKVQVSKKMKETIITIRCSQSAIQREPPAVDQPFNLSKIFSLSTVHREYAALKALPYYDLCEDVINARSQKSHPTSSADIREAMEAHQLNEPQAIAILGALTTTGFSLIQGPPGTGKTLTICGMVGAFMSGRSAQATKVYAGRTSTNNDKVAKKKILICAPSNAAIDEVAKRIRDGVLNSTGHRVAPSVVRVGNESSINISTKDISLDYLVDQALEKDSGNKTNGSDHNNQIAALRSKIESVKRDRQAKQEEIGAIKENISLVQELQRSIDSLNAERQRLTQRLNKMRDEQKAASRSLDATRRKVRLEILLDADVVCSTLSGAGHTILDQFDFEMVIIDEAAQCIELSSLIPLKYRCTRCILVGDPKQLPPTVISPVATEFYYNHSLFSRIERQQPDAVHLLSIQYRMHPDISKLPSMLFYSGRLLDGPSMETKRQQPWHSSPQFQPYRFFNVAEGSEQSAAAGHSLINRQECQAAVALYNRLTKQFSNVDFDFRIGIVSMYRAQVQEMKRQFETRFGKDILGKVDFNTVDGFQGQEKDIIILSCVRGGPGVSSVGFLRDERRMNVSITRSRSSLFILGNASTLERSDEFWRRIVTDARTRGCLVNANAKFFEQPFVTQQSSNLAKSKSKAKGNGTTGAAPPTPIGLQTPHALSSSKQYRPSPTKPDTKGNRVTSVTRTELLLPSGSRPSSLQSNPLPLTTSALSSKSHAAKPEVVRPSQSKGTSGESEGLSTGPPNLPRPVQPPKPKKKKEPPMFIPRKRPLGDGPQPPAKRKNLEIQQNVHAASR